MRTVKTSPAKKNMEKKKVNPILSKKPFSFLPGPISRVLIFLSSF